jgi:hypothetical protein
MIEESSSNSRAEHRFIRSGIIFGRYINKLA